MVLLMAALTQNKMEWCIKMLRVTEHCAPVVAARLGAREPVVLVIAGSAWDACSAAAPALGDSVSSALFSSK